MQGETTRSRCDADRSGVKRNAQFEFEFEFESKISG